MPKKPQRKAEQAGPPPRSTDEVVRQALNVKRPPGGWPWENKRKKPAPKKG